MQTLIYCDDGPMVLNVCIRRGSVVLAILHDPKPGDRQELILEDYEAEQLFAVLQKWKRKKSDF